MNNIQNKRNTHNGKRGAWTESEKQDETNEAINFETIQRIRLQLHRQIKHNTWCVCEDTKFKEW